MTEKPETQYIVRDKHGNPWGPFRDPIEAARWARRKWPGEEQDSFRDGNGWDVEVLWPPTD